MEIERLDPDAEAIAKLVKCLQSDDPTTANDAYFQAGLWRGIVIGLMYMSAPPELVVARSNEDMIRDQLRTTS